MHSDAAVVKHAKASGMVGCGVVQTGDRNERPPRRPRHDRIDSDQRRADDMARGLENAAKRRGVTGIQIAEPGRGPLAHQIDICGTMKPLELLSSCGTSATTQDPAVHAAIV